MQKDLGLRRVIDAVGALSPEFSARRQQVRGAIAEKHSELETRPAGPRHLGFPDLQRLDAEERQRIEHSPSFRAAAKLAIEIRNLRVAGQALATAADEIAEILPELAVGIRAKSKQTGAPVFVTAFDHSAEFGNQLARAHGGQQALTRFQQAFLALETSADYLEAASKQHGLSQQNLNQLTQIRSQVLASVGWLPPHPLDHAAGRDLAFFRAEAALTGRFIRSDSRSVLAPPNPHQRKKDAAQNRLLQESWRHQQHLREARGRRGPSSTRPATQPSRQPTRGQGR